MPGLKPRAWLKDFVVVYRLQFPLPVNYVCYAVWGTGFATGDVRRLADPPALLSVVAGLLLTIGPLALNVAIDMPTDLEHGEKDYLAFAAGRFGRSRTLNWALTEMGAGLLAALAIGFWWQRWWPVVIACVILAAQLAYNVPPLHLKRHGFAGSVAFGLASMLPCLLGYTTTGHPLDAAMWLIFCGFTVLSIGRTVWWAVPDEAADATTGVGTPAVRYGRTQALATACRILFGGLLLLGWGLWWRYGAAWAVFGLAAHIVFTGFTLVQLAQTRQGRPPNARDLLRRTLPMVTAGEVLLAITAYSA